MAFSCLFQLNNGAINETDEVIFLKYIPSVFDSFRKNSVKIAEVIFNGSRASIFTNCPCYISSKAGLKAGERIIQSTVIGYFSAEGEDILYSKPYAILKIE